MRAGAMSLIEGNAVNACAGIWAVRHVCCGARMLPLKPCVRTALGAVALALASGLHAAGLFLPVGPDNAVPDVAPVAKSAPARRSTSAVPEWERRVRIARHELTAARDDVENAGAGRLLLNMRDGVRLNVVVERTAPTKWGYSLSGRAAGRNVGFVTLVVHEEAVAASIWTPDSAYELSYLGGGIHTLRDVTNAPPVECAGALPAELSADDATAQGGADDGSMVDILVVWTPLAEELHGGKPQVMSRIDTLVAYTNDAFERSGAFVSLHLVGAEKVDDVKTGTKIDLSRLDRDHLNNRRDALGADLIYLLTSFGRGSAGTYFSHGPADVFAHEIGHNLGIGHERHEFEGITGGTKGYENGFTTGRCHKTIMSYGTECIYIRSSLPFYASPWRYGVREGRPLGVTRFSKDRGTRGPADAVLTINRNRHRVANFRPSRNRE